MRGLLLALLVTVPAWAQNVSSVQPGNGAAVISTRPTITAWFDQNIESAQIWIDGREFTGMAQVSQNAISVTPNYNLDYGVHSVRVVGKGLFGEKSNAEWSFSIVNAAPAPAPAPAAGDYGTWRSTSGNTFVISASGNQVYVTLYTPQGQQYPGGGTWLAVGRSFRYTIPALSQGYSVATLDANNPNILHVQDGQGAVYTWTRVR